MTEVKFSQQQVWSYGLMGYDVSEMETAGSSETLAPYHMLEDHYFEWFINLTTRGSLYSLFFKNYS
jgi:hypothetical protein